jgi:NTE family protein
MVTMALQGGGSHGAFTWGVLDRLLEDGRIDIEAISGASAGAMNAVATAYGYAVGGRDGAREALARFWDAVASRPPFSLGLDPVAMDEAALTAATPPAALNAMVTMARFFSPAQFNPLDINPLRDLLTEQIDFERLRRASSIKLFVAATQVSTGMLKLFRNRQLSVEVLLASACLPSLHHPVEIDGEAYWDGGLTANPPIFPLIHLCSARDVMVVLLHPCRRPETPATIEQIAHRLGEISFNSAFFTELGGLALAKRAAEQASWCSNGLERRLKRLNMHVVEAHELMSQLDAISKLNTDAAFIYGMRDQGRGRATLWLEQHYNALGARSSFNLSPYLQ